jgi:hypothetical protein
MQLSNSFMLGISILPSFQDAEFALFQLRRSIFLVDQISFLAKCNDYADALSVPLPEQYTVLKLSDSNPIPINMMTSLTGLVTYPNRLTLADGSAVVVGGRLGSMLATSQAFGGAIVQALQALGVPEEMARMYRDRVDQGYCLITVEGPSENIQSAERILQAYRPQHWDTYEFMGTEMSSLIDF